MRNHFKDIIIPFKYVSIFASGVSAWDIQGSEYNYIFNNSFVIGINECIRKLHARFWNDWRVTQKLEKYYNLNRKDCIFISRDYAFKVSIPMTIRNKVDYWYDKNIDETNNRSYTVLSVIELLKKYFNDKIILIFGLDCNLNDIRRKTIDENNNEVIQKQEIYKDNLLEVKQMFENKPKEFYTNIWNCNLNSNVNIPKKAYKEII